MNFKLQTTDLNWVKIIGQSGIKGWFKVEGYHYITVLPKSADDVLKVCLIRMSLNSVKPLGMV